jgi:hypothetical protein
MKTLFFTFLILPILGHATCPKEIMSQDQSYCMEITWDYGEKKSRGDFKSSEELSPFLTPMKEIPQKWIYSKAYFKLWKKDDPSKTAVEVPNFRVFPFMHMENGHNHSASYEFDLDTQDKVYVFHKMSFRQMRGCWTLRWTTLPEDTMESSKLLMPVTEFTNLADSQIDQQVKICQRLIGTSSNIHH